MFVQATCGRVKVESIASTANEAYLQARTKRLVMVIVPGGVWLCSERVARRLQLAGYEVL
jgi:hypothetical protein